MNKLLILKRIANTPQGVFGVLIDGVIPFAVSLELPWRNNANNVSCIPPSPRFGNIDLYICQRIEHEIFGRTFIVETPYRSGILFHWGNKLEDTKGCILVAEEFGLLAETPAILNSRTHPNKGFNEFVERFGGYSQFVMKIVWC